MNWSDNFDDDDSRSEVLLGSFPEPGFWHCFLV